jgi:hypothetical protein
MSTIVNQQMNNAQCQFRSSAGVLVEPFNSATEVGDLWPLFPTFQLSNFPSFQLLKFESYRYHVYGWDTNLSTTWPKEVWGGQKKHEVAKVMPRFATSYFGFRLHTSFCYVILRFATWRISHVSSWHHLIGPRAPTTTCQILQQSDTSRQLWEKVPSLLRTKIRTRIRICRQKNHPKIFIKMLKLKISKTQTI